MLDNTIVLPWDITIVNLDKNISNESLGDISQEKAEDLIRKNRGASP